jgi:hypothetical protein
VFADRPEVLLDAPKPASGREFRPDLFVCEGLPQEAQVLLVEDSWTSGANVLSAAAALKRAGAIRVNAMILGRLLNPAEWGPSREFIENGGLRLDFGDGKRPGFDPRRSPWATVK